MWLIIVLLKQKMVFALPLSGLASFKNDGDAAIVLKASDGSEYRMVCPSFFPKKERGKWAQALTDAIVGACAGTKAQSTGDVVEFVKLT